MENFWNERYSKKEFIYGTNPNVFFKEQLGKLPAGKILLPCEGEGRNAVYAATQGWEVEAFDFSKEGFNKATALANKNGVCINYRISEAANAQYPEDFFDAIALIFAHFPPSERKKLHQKCIMWLKPGGTLILEAFNPLQIQNPSGGPKDPSMLYTIEILKEDFKGLNIQLATLDKGVLNEGAFHQGTADLIKFIGTKNK